MAKQQYRVRYAYNMTEEPGRGYVAIFGPNVHHLETMARIAELIEATLNAAADFAKPMSDKPD